MQEACFNKPKDKWRPYKMANDSEATRAAGIDWTNDEAVMRAAMHSICAPGDTMWRYGELFVSHAADGRLRWAGIGKSWKEARTSPNVVAFEAQNRPVRENPDLMRDMTDAVSGEKPKCGVPQYAGSNLCTLDDGHGGDHECHRGVMIHCWPKGAPAPVAPDSGKDAFEAWLEGFRFRYQNGMEFTPVEKDIARHAWNGRAALESKPAHEGKVKVEWRVDREGDSGYVPIPHALYEDEALGRQSYLAALGYQDRFKFSGGHRFVKIDTRETVVETRKKEA